MVAELMGAYGGRLLIAILGVGVGFLCLVGVLWLLRGRRGPSPFIRGGRNRQPRLQVLDAAAVDTRRRLVLVRRDNVEHLIMIGGPTDIVIESGISGIEATETGAASEASSSSRSQPQTQPQVSAPSVASAPPPEIRRDPSGQQSVAPAQLKAVVRPQQVGRSEDRTGAPPVAPVAPQPNPSFLANAMPVSQPKPPVVREPVVEEAANILDAARSRVFQGPTEPVRASQPADVTEQGIKPLGSDFERILEEEMATNLAAREPGTASVQPQQERQATSPERPRVTGATPEPSLQDEMARIFGEMSVTRDR